MIGAVLIGVVGSIGLDVAISPLFFASAVRVFDSDRLVRSGVDGADGRPVRFGVWGGVGGRRD